MAETQPKGTLSSLDYEGFVRETYESLIEKNLGQVFASKKYRGKRSGHDHQIDVSIELEVADLAILVLVECKHYKAKVEISDLLEFAQRLDDIGAHKGVLVSTIGFQKGAVKIANAHGIALVRTVPVWESVANCMIVGNTDRLIARPKPKPRQRENLMVVDPSFSTVTMQQPKTLGDSWLDVLVLLTADPKCPLCERGLRSAVREATVDADKIDTYNASVEAWFHGLIRRCPECSLSIDLDHFEEGNRWKKCKCGKMIHISDVAVAETLEAYRERNLPKKVIWICGCSRVFSRQELSEMLEKELAWLPDGQGSVTGRVLWW